MTFPSQANQISPLEKRNQQLFDEMVKAESLKPTFTLSKGFVFVIALMIHSITLVFAITALTLLGVALAGLLMGNKAAALALTFLALICGLIAWLIGPRFGKWPDNVVSREDYPALYDLADGVAKTLGAPPIGGIQFIPEYNASFRKVGLRQKSLMSLGVPLWAVLTEPERIALIGHELAHGVNGDFTRGFVVWNAVQTLHLWHRMAATGTRYRSIFAVVLVVFWLLSAGLLSLLHRLLFHESRRAEYLADGLGARVGGTDAMLAVLDKVQFSGNYNSYLKNMRQVKIKPETLFDRYRTHIERILSTPEELIKLERMQRVQDADYSVTHPPMTFRKDFLKARYVPEPAFALTPEALAQLRNEIDPAIARLQYELLRGVPEPAARP